MSAHRRFSPPGTTARPAREFIVTTIARALPRADTTVADDCELVIGELVTNACNAHATTIDVSIELHHTRIELAVTDDAHGWPVLRVPGPAATSGRGLQIVAALAARWGVTVAEDGRTTVWAHVPCNPLTTTAVQCRW